jgi:two-component system response regulator MprA
MTRPLTILIIDNDPGVIAIFSRMLRLAGYDVVTALTAAAGLLAFGESQPDAVLLDLRMPLVDGVAFLRRLRESEKERRTPVAVISGDYFLEEALVAELKALGAKVFFKPVWLTDLIDITRELLRDAPEGG